MESEERIMALQTEFTFKLPQGFTDKDGKVYQEGTMRLATAADEIMPLRDTRVQQNQDYLMVLILSRVILNLGDLKTVDTHVIENLSTSDLAYLQKFYEHINSWEPKSTETKK